MSAVTQADSTYTAISNMVRRLTASASEAALSTADLDKSINDVYENDFPYAIKIDQTRSVYKFYTIPNVDRYPTDVNNNQGYRSPVYVEGILGNLFKDRGQFFNLYPRSPTQMMPVGGNGVQTHFTFNLFNNNANPFPQPNFGILSTSVVIGGVDKNGKPIRVIDDGGAVVISTGVDDQGNSVGVGSNTTIGQLIYLQSNQVGNNVFVDSASKQQNAVPPLSPLPVPAPKYTPPITNLSPAVGTVNYVTSAFDFTLPVAPAAGTMLNVWCNQYVVGRPNSVLFWNNELTVRPVPDNVYCIEIETYLSPVQFMKTNDNPILKQWWKYIAYLSACEITRQRQDPEGVQNLMEGMKRQESLVLERQSIEEIHQPTVTLFNSTSYGCGYGYGGSLGGGL